MPHSGRLDIPNLPQQVIARGIDHVTMILNDDHRRDFTARFQKLREKK